MRYCNRTVVSLLVGFQCLTTISGTLPPKDVYVEGGLKWTTYDVPPSGADLTLNVKRGTAKPITTSGVRIQDNSDGDLVIWKRQAPCTGDLHVYKIFGVSPGREWVAITGSCAVASSSSGVGCERRVQTITPASLFEVGVLNVDLDVDSNNDEIITDIDDSIEENLPGKLISVNDDDDDGDGNPDNVDCIISGTAAQKSADKIEMAEVRLSLKPAISIPDGHAFLRVSAAGRIRVFDQNNAQFLSAVQTEKEVPWASVNGSTLSFRAEGLSHGAVVLELVVKEGSTVIGLDKVVIKSVEADISVYSTSDGCFAGYAQQCTPGRKFGFDTGRDFIEGLINKTSSYGMLGDINVFSHAWTYQSSFGVDHDGGFWGGGPNASGFYGAVVVGDHANARTLADLQAALNTGTIKLFPGRRIYLEGCHSGEVGSFASRLSTITSRQVISACGSSSERTDGAGHLYFSSGAENQAELTDPDYDGWLKGAAQAGASFYAW